MARSNKPLIWGLFAAGGTAAAFVIPALVLITLMAGYGYVPASLGYENMHGFVSGWLGKVILFGIITLCLWHAAHRMRTAMYALGLRADGAVAFIGYSVAAAGTLLTIWFFLQ